jgi:hypothetical protein
MKYVYLSLSLIALFGCSQQKQAKVEEASIDPKILISCEGIGAVKLTDSYADLQKKFGDTALSAHENNVAGKFTSVWENDTRQINVYWKEAEEPFKTIRYIETVDPMAPYMTKDSIGVGTSLRDLVKKNGSMAITFNNFTADNSPGLITGLGEGEIVKSNPCFGGILEVSDQKPIDVQELEEFNKLQEVKSFERTLQRMDVVLSAIRLTAKK